MADDDGHRRRERSGSSPRCGGSARARAKPHAHGRSGPAQKVAMGLSTEPVAPGTAAGEAVTRNSQRLRCSASRPTNSRSQIIEDRHAHGHDREGVNGLRNAGDAGGYDVLRAIRAENRDVALVQPFCATHMESGKPLRTGPWALGVAPRPTAGAHQDDVAGSDLDASFLFPGVEVFRINADVGLEVIDALEAGDVHQTPRVIIPFLKLIMLFLAAPFSVT